MKIRQFYHNNQFLLTDNYGNTFLQSYGSVVAKIDRNGTLTLGEDWNYSNTTLRHVYQFLIDYEYAIKGEQAEIARKLSTSNKRSDVIYKAVKDKVVEVVEL